MPKDIVRRYRKIYERYFMVDTLVVIPKGVIRTQAFDGVLGFPSQFIIVNFDGEPHPKINASNMIQGNEEKGYNGYIEVNPDLLTRPKELLKVKLAEEWIEAMMGFRSPKSTVHKSIRGKIPLALLFNSLKRRGFWQDRPEEHDALHSALRSLLVPRDLMEAAAREMHGMSIDDLKMLVAASSKEAQSKLEHLVLSFAAQYYIDKELVWDRLMGFLYNGSEDESEEKSS